MNSNFEVQIIDNTVTKDIEERFPNLAKEIKQQDRLTNSFWYNLSAEAYKEWLKLQQENSKKTIKELALKLKEEFEKEHSQHLITCKCSCGKYATIVMSNYVTGNVLYAILYCSHCNKFYKHSGGSSLGVDDETTYSGSNVSLEYGSIEWKKAVNQIEQGNIFAKVQ